VIQSTRHPFVDAPPHVQEQAADLVDQRRVRNLGVRDQRAPNQRLREFPVLQLADGLILDRLQIHQRQAASSLTGGGSGGDTRHTYPNGGQVDVADLKGGQNHGRRQGEVVGELQELWVAHGLLHGVVRRHAAGSRPPRSVTWDDRLHVAPGRVELKDLRHRVLVQVEQRDNLRVFHENVNGIGAAAAHSHTVLDTPQESRTDLAKRPGRLPTRGEWKDVFHQ
jgi:hypothetical protein